MVVRDPRRASLTYGHRVSGGPGRAGDARTYRGAKSTGHVNRRRDCSFELRVRSGSWRPTRSRNYVSTTVRTYVVSCPGPRVVYLPARGESQLGPGRDPRAVCQSTGYSTSRQGTMVHDAWGTRKCRKGHVRRRVLVGEVRSDKIAGRQIARLGVRVSGKAAARVGTTPCAS